MGILILHITNAVAFLLFGACDEHDLVVLHRGSEFYLEGRIEGLSEDYFVSRTSCIKGEISVRAILERRRIGLPGPKKSERFTSINNAIPRTLEIEAPSDVFVADVVATDGRVSKGTLLLKLKSHFLTQSQIRLVLLREQINFAERPFLDGRVDEEIKLIKSKAKYLSQKNQDAEAKLKLAESQVQLGTLDKSEYLAIVLNYTAIKTNYLDAELASNQAEKKKQELIDKISLAKDKLRLEEDALADLMMSMEVKANADGNFTSSVAVGSFIKKGHLLGRIML
jgi:biotin carboxyl carrier protein